MLVSFDWQMVCWQLEWCPWKWLLSLVCTQIIARFQLIIKSICFVQFVSHFSRILSNIQRSNEWLFSSNRICCKSFGNLEKIVAVVQNYPSCRERSLHNRIYPASPSLSIPKGFVELQREISWGRVIAATGARLHLLWFNLKSNSVD